MLNKFVFALLVTLYDETVVSAHQLQKKITLIYHFGDCFLVIKSAKCESLGEKFLIPRSRKNHSQVAKNFLIYVLYRSSLSLGNFSSDTYIDFLHCLMSFEKPTVTAILLTTSL